MTNVLVWDHAAHHTHCGSGVFGSKSFAHQSIPVYHFSLAFG
jgi:hypothetical protein